MRRPTGPREIDTTISKIKMQTPGKLDKSDPFEVVMTAISKITGERLRCPGRVLQTNDR
jgi:hypothetical protein